MHESGVDLGFDLWEDLETELNNCYSLKSQPLQKVDIGSETVLQKMDAPVKIKQDPDMLLSMSAPSNSSSYLMRTNFKQQLQKEHIMQIEKRHTSSVKDLLNPSNVMLIPNDKPNSPHGNSDVPVGILKVTTKLENPTSYHLKQQQKKQLKEYLNTKHRLNPGPALPLDPTNQHQDSFYFNTLKSPASPDLPDSSVASANSEVDSLLEDFFGRLDTVNEDINMFNDCTFPSTLPTNTGLMDLYAPDLSNEQPYDNMSNHVSASCPANVKQEVPTSPCDTTMFNNKDRQKKDNHNMIERRRRYNINDRIRELGGLIPKSDCDSKQNKGTILKSSVDYIRRLRKDKERLKYVETQKKGLQEMNKKLTLRVQELELILRASGIGTQLPTPNLHTNFKHVAGLQLANILMNGTSHLETPESNVSSPRQSVSSAMEASPESTDEISQLSSIHSEDDCTIMEDD